jgi:NAD(P)-dependent dehydrogenase (short-subunit alcohol dehydrogenase family)
VSKLDDLFGLHGQVAVVTGASSGIGVDFARALAGAGAKVVVAARRVDRLESLVAELEAEGHEAMAVACDVVSEEDVDHLVGSTIARFGKLDVMVNNAGITDVVRIEEETLDRFESVVSVNLRGVFLCAKRAGMQMLESGGGSIINVASVLGLVGTGQVPQAGYAASKGGVVNLTRELAAQWARKGIRVNAICPGWFPTEMTDEMFGDERSDKWMKGRTPMGRGGTSGELDTALLYLASPASSFATGQIITVDGGWTIV